MRARGPDGGSESEHVQDGDTVYVAPTYLLQHLLQTRHSY